MGAAVCHRNKETQGKLLADTSYSQRFEVMDRYWVCKLPFAKCIIQLS